MRLTNVVHSAVIVACLRVLSKVKPCDLHIIGLSKSRTCLLKEEINSLGHLLPPFLNLTSLSYVFPSRPSLHRISLDFDNPADKLEHLQLHSQVLHLWAAVILIHSQGSLSHRHG